MRQSLDRCLRHPALVAVTTVLVAIPIVGVGLRIGSDFMPQLDEGAFLLQTVLPAEAALDEVDRLNHRVEDMSARDTGGRGRRAPDWPRGANRRSDAAHGVGCAGGAQGQSLS